MRNKSFLGLIRWDLGGCLLFNLTIWSPSQWGLLWLLYLKCSQRFLVDCLAFFFSIVLITIQRTVYFIYYFFLYLPKFECKLKAGIFAFFWCIPCVWNSAWNVVNNHVLLNEWINEWMNGLHGLQGQKGLGGGPLCHLLPVWPEASYSPSVRLISFNCKMGGTVPSLQGLGIIKIMNINLSV